MLVKRAGTKNRSIKSSKKPRLPGLSATDERRMRYRLRRIACSEPWVDEQIRETVDRSANGKPIVYRYFDSHVYPPGGTTGTAMRWCHGCGRYTPPGCVALIEHRQGRAGDVFASSLQCDDCRIGQDDERFRELYEAGLHLRPASSQSFVQRAVVRSERAVRKSDA